MNATTYNTLLTGPKKIDRCTSFFPAYYAIDF